MTALCVQSATKSAFRASATSAALGSSYVNDFNRFGRLFRVYVQAEGEDRRKPEDIGRIHVRSETGDMVPLSTIASVTSQSGTEITNRFNLFRSAEIQGVPGRGATRASTSPVAQPPTARSAASPAAIAGALRRDITNAPSRFPA